MKHYLPLKETNIPILEYLVDLLISKQVNIDNKVKWSPRPIPKKLGGKRRWKLRGKRPGSIWDKY